jgi:hypothetical protein
MHNNVQTYSCTYWELLGALSANATFVSIKANERFNALFKLMSPPP